MKGWVYIITNEAMPNLLKVGFSTKDPESRANELHTTGVPYRYVVKYDALVNEPRDVEQKAHILLNAYIANKEWFKCDIATAIIAIRQAANGSIILQSNNDDLIPNENEPLIDLIVPPDIIINPSDEPLLEIKIGVIARTVFRNVLKSGKVPKDEIERMQDKDYSKKTFGIQYPVLQKTNNPNSKKPENYYAKPVKIADNYYFICSEWYETLANNDRPYLMKWLKPYC